MVNQKPSLRNIELSIAYAGQHFLGSQIQSQGRTVQGEIQAVLRKLLDHPGLRIQAASRTDAGVHAHDQRFAFRTTSTIPVENLVRTVNHRMPSDLRIQWGREVGPERSVRYDAKGKHYTYLISSEQVMPPAFAPFVWERGQSLNVQAMNTAAQHLVGTRCFRALQSRRDAREHSVTTLHRVTVTRIDKLVAIDVMGHSFLYNMVRNIVGSLLPVGLGEWTPEMFREHLDSGERKRMGMTAPASGLHLFEVYYRDAPWPPSQRREHFVRALAEASKIMQVAPPTQI